MKKNNNGQSLVEVLVAIAIVALIILGIIKATSISVKDENYSQNQVTATSLAQNQMSEIVADKNTNYQEFFTPPFASYPEEQVSLGVFCLKTELTPDDPTNPSTFDILISVFWGAGSGNYTCEGLNYLYKYDLQSKITNQ